MKETAGLSYVGLKDAVLMRLSGRMQGCAGDIENRAMTAVRWSGVAVLWWYSRGDF